MLRSLASAAFSVFCVIGDTGTGIHIVGREKLADSELKLVDNTGPSVRLNTANGQARTQDRIT
eukprot:15116391-Heterocapsa_arctica.AAC.1